MPRSGDPAALDRGDARAPSPPPSRDGEVSRSTVRDLAVIEVPRGARVAVVSDLHLSGTVTEAAAAATAEMIRMLDSWSGPGVFIIAGDGFEQLHEPVSPIDEILEAHRAWTERVARFAADPHHTVVVLSGNHDGNIAWDPAAAETLQRELGAGVLALAVDLVCDTGEGTQRVHVVHGNQDDQYNAFIDPRSPIDTPTGHHVVRQVLPQLDRAIRPGGLLDGLTWLSEPMQAGEMVGSRLLYRGIIGRVWWLAIPFLAAVLLRLVAFVPGVDSLLLAGADDWLVGLGLAVPVMLLLAAVVAFFTLLRVHRALSETELGGRAGVGAHNSAAREHAARLIEDGYAGMVSGHTHQPELSVVGEGFYANSGCAVEVLGARAAWFGLPRPFVSVRRCSRIEIDAGDELEVRLVLADVPVPAATSLEQFVLKPDRDTPVTPTVVASLPRGALWPVDPHLLGAFARTRRARRRAAGLLIAIAAINVLSAVLTTPSTDERQALRTIFPDQFPRAAGLSVVLIAVAFVGLSRGVRRGYHHSWLAALLLLLVGAGANILKGIDIEEGVVNLAVAILLLVERRFFRVKVTGPRNFGAWAAALSIAALGLAATLAVAFRETDRLDGLGIALVVATIILLTLVARRPSKPREPSADARRAAALEAAQIVEWYGGDTLDHTALRDDKSVMFAGNGMVAYTVDDGVMVVSPDPICPPDERADVWASAMDHAATHGWRISVIAANASWLATYHAANLHDVYIGDEAIVDCDAFDLDRPEMTELRQRCSALRHEGHRVELVKATDLDERTRGLLLDLADGDAAPANRHGFAGTIGRVLDPRDDDLLLAICSGPGDAGPIAFNQYVPAWAINGYALDYASRTGEEHERDQIAELLLAETVHWVKIHGHKGLGLGLAAPAGVVSGAGAPRLPTERRLLDRFVDPGELAWRHRIHQPFAPAWRPRYLVTDATRFVRARDRVEPT